jgi:predicted DNA-binding transcriptional regulator AlpA
MPAQSQFITAKSVAARYGVSAMTRYRWERDAKLRFPRPIVINKRKFWAVPDLEAWENTRYSVAESFGNTSS